MVATRVRFRQAQLLGDTLGLTKYRLLPTVLAPSRHSLAAMTLSALGVRLMLPLLAGVNWFFWKMTPFTVLGNLELATG